MPPSPVDPHRIGAKRPAPALDVAIAAIADGQEGLITRGQLAEIGAGRGAIRLRVQQRRLNRVHPGVYAVGHRALSQDGRRLAAVLTVGADAALSHRSAAALWGLTSWSGRHEVTTPRDIRRRVVAVHSMPLPADEVREVGGIPVTCVPRTLLDLAGVVRRRELERAFEQAVVRRLDDPLSLPVLIERYPTRPGIGALLGLLARLEAAEVTREELERSFKRFIRLRRLPRPGWNLCVEGYEVDCVWPAAGLIVELDGGATHGHALAFERDRERDRVLVAAGWRVIRITWRQLHDDPGRIATDLRAALGRPRREIRTA